MTGLMQTYARADLAFERGEGAWLIATDGRRYLDFTAGIAVNGLGHAHPHLVAALKAQAEKLWHCSNLFRIPEGERLAERLCAASGFAERVFFSNSGGEAIEGGLKAIRKFQDDFGDPQRYRVITIEGAFHGRSLAAIAAGRQEKHLKGFGPVVEGFDQVAFGNLNELRAAIGPETAAILCEPVQGEGGMRAASADYLKGLRAVADEFGLLLMFDEVQCGMGRTGKFFAHHWAGVKPDLVATAKALGGGFPVGALLASEKVAAALTAGSHGSTFGGNPLAMAVGNAVLDVMLADGFMAAVEARARELGEKLDRLIQRHPTVFAERRGKGLMIGIKCHLLNTDLMTSLRAAGLLTVTAGDNVLRLLPPLIVSAAEIDQALAILDRVAGDTARAVAAAGAKS